MIRKTRSIFAVGALIAGVSAAPIASAVPVSFTLLTGSTGGVPAVTAVFRADLSSVGGLIQSVSIVDDSGGIGGSPGQFSGFDLDAIKISQTFCTTASCAAGAAGLSLFNFVSGTVFTPGSQAAPTDPKLFGTGPTGTTVDNAVATLGLFDADGSTTAPDGFLSLGFNGSIGFNLTSVLNVGVGGPYYLYFGEVGNNGEAAASSITVSSAPVPEPATLGLLGLGLVGVGFAKRRAR